MGATGDSNCPAYIINATSIKKYIIAMTDMSTGSDEDKDSVEEWVNEPVHVNDII